MGVVYALLLALCAISQGALAESSDLVQPVPAQVAAYSHRQLLQTTDGSYAGYGYGAHTTGYGYGNQVTTSDYGGYSNYGGGGEVLGSSSRRRLLQSDGGYGYGTYTSGGYGGYGQTVTVQSGEYGGYGSYGGGATARRLSEVDFSLQPRDELLVYAEQQQQQQEEQIEKLQAAADGLSAAAAAALKQARSSKQSGLSVPAGQCYCRYDVDYNIWALAEDVCKQALYERCKTESGLPCQWLDKFYAPAAGPAHSLPHEKDIAAFLHEDCSPQPPCACAGLRFDGSDAVATAVGCCRDLKASCKTPFSGLCCKKVAAFCSDDQAVPMLAAWTAHNLHHTDCSNYEGVPFKFVPYKDMLAAAAKQQQSTEGTAEENLLQQAVSKMEAEQSAAAAGSTVYGLDARTLVVVAAGAVCAAVVAVLFAMMRRSDDYSHTFEDADKDQEDQEVVGHTNNKGYDHDGLLPTVGSGGRGMSRVVSVSTSGGGGGVREPLLQSHHSAPVGRMSSTGQSGRFSSPGDYMPRPSSQVNLDNMS